MSLGKDEEACLTLRHALPRAMELNQLTRLVDCVGAASVQTQRLASWTELRVRLAGASNNPQGLLDAIGTLSSEVSERYASYHAWASVRLSDYGQAVRLTAQIDESQLEPGLGWRSRGEALAYLNDPDWRVSFARARTYLRGVPLGLCLREEGALSALKGDFVAARALLAEAFSWLRDHPFEAAWTKYNQGIVSLNVVLPEAETHFLEMLDLLRSPAAQPFQARGWCGLGASRRALGEYERAISAYSTARRLARDADDRCQAWFGIGHTNRVAGLLTPALEALHVAARHDPKAANGSSFIDASLAAVHLQLEDEPATRLALNRAERAGQWSLEHRERWTVVNAELCRRRGQPRAALANLEGLTMHALWMREERKCFPELFALLGTARKSVPAVLPVTVQTVVRVRAGGSLRVEVNGRIVPISPAGMAGQILVLLLEGEESVESLLLRLHPNLGALRRRAKAQQVSKYVTDLRRALGWEDSIKAVGGGIYRLDDAVTWQYDINEARAARQPVERFLDGVYADWVLELGRSLSKTVLVERI